jgi:hypothetical protein
MEPGWRDDKIFDIIKNNPGINQDTIIKLSEINKDPVFDSLERLIQQKKIEFAKIKKGEKVFFVRVSENIPSFNENIDRMKEDFEIMRGIVLKSLELVQKKSSNEIVSICLNCLETIFSYKQGLEFIIASNTDGRYPKIWNELLRESNELFNDIAQGIRGNNLYTKIMEYLQDKNMSSLQELNWFVKSKQTED